MPRCDGKETRLSVVLEGHVGVFFSLSLFFFDSSGGGDDGSWNDAVSG